MSPIGHKLVPKQPQIYCIQPLLSSHSDLLRNIFATAIFQVKSAIENSLMCHLLSIYHRHCTVEWLDRRLRVWSDSSSLLATSDTSLCAFERGWDERVETFNSLRFIAPSTRKTRRNNVNFCLLPEDCACCAAQRTGTSEAKLMKTAVLPTLQSKHCYSVPHLKQRFVVQFKSHKWKYFLKTLPALQCKHDSPALLLK